MTSPKTQYIKTLDKEMQTIRDRYNHTQMAYHRKLLEEEYNSWTFIYKVVTGRDAPELEVPKTKRLNESDIIKTIRDNDSMTIEEQMEDWRNG